MPTNEAKNKAIEKSLVQLLRRLKETKIRKELWGYQGEFEMLNEGIKALENCQFISVDDFESVKELMEIEQFFNRSVALSYFYFPNYRRLIPPVLLAYTEMEVQLDTLEMKSHDLSCRGHRIAATEAQRVVSCLRNLNHEYFIEKQIDYKDYKAMALQAITKSQAVLEQHRGYKQLLGNLILLILTAGTAFIIHKALSGNFFFFQKTDSAKQLDALSQTIMISPNVPHTSC